MKMHTVDLHGDRTAKNVIGLSPLLEVVEHANLSQDWPQRVFFPGADLLPKNLIHGATPLCTNGVPSNSDEF
jgi:hypothetical protein